MSEDKICKIILNDAKISLKIETSPLGPFYTSFVGYQWGYVCYDMAQGETFGGSHGG